MKMRTFALSAAAMTAVQMFVSGAYAEEVDTEALLARIEKLEADNARLMALVEGMLDQQEPERIEPAPAPAVAPAAQPVAANDGAAGMVGTDAEQKRRAGLVAREHLDQPRNALAGAAPSIDVDLEGEQLFGHGIPRTVQATTSTTVTTKSQDIDGFEQRSAA